MTSQARHPAEAATLESSLADRFLTRAVVNLDAIASNVHALRRHANSPQVMAIVKANGYGHGAVMTARAAVRAGAAWLGVYSVVEGLVLRDAGITTPVLVLGPFTAQDARELTVNDLTPTITSLESAGFLQAASENVPVPIHVKLDTGLQRAGVAAIDALDFVRALDRFPSLRVQGLFTHFAASDEADKTATYEQMERFRDAAWALNNAGYRIPIHHTANTGALLDLPETHLSLVRTGIGLYGYYPSDAVSRPIALTPALRLLSRVTRIHDVPIGAGVGYGFEHRCAIASRIALAPLGYGDGLPRMLGNSRGRVIIRGQLAPIVGRVSMDQITIDVTNIPDVQMGNDVTVIGTDGIETQTADDVAAMAGTISYDILTGLLPRIPRVYIEAGKEVGVMSYRSGPFVTQPAEAYAAPAPPGG
jgi:alanine racemase